MALGLPLDSLYELEQQFILRLPPVAAERLSRDIESGINFKDNLSMEFKPDMRNSIVRYNGEFFKGKLVDLPCIVESMKTTDKKAFYKTADISQMMVCVQDDRPGPIKGTAAYLELKSNKSTPTSMNRDNREFQYLHGLTPPLKNVLRRRFRKTRRKRHVDMPKIEREVKALLKNDLEAESVKWEVIWSEPPGSSQTGLDADKGEFRGRNVSSMGAPKDGAEDDSDEESSRRRRDLAVGRKDVFGELSSSSCSSPSSDDEASRETRLRSPRKPKSGPQTLLPESDQGDFGKSKKSSHFLLSSAASDLDENSNLAQQLQLSDDSNAEEMSASLAHEDDQRNLGDEEEDAQAAQIMTAQDQEPQFHMDEDSNQFNLLGESVDMLSLQQLKEANELLDDDEELAGGELLTADALDESALMSFPPAPHRP
ncbi:transcription initiation factor TFIID subunit 7 [Cichlidogyrus casuarinus]|uniref:Transcription initiation factor TFIID subunit 7 n=1 Tax=Cichlidogyrus casuarinus TaxID=1844966 RepID=A0ABD2Q1K4_9PLAT